MICRSFTSTRFGHSGLFPALPISYFGEGETVILSTVADNIALIQLLSCPAANLFFLHWHWVWHLVQSSSCLEPNHPLLCVRKNLTALLSFCLSDSHSFKQLFPISNSSWPLRAPSKPLSSSSPPPTPNRLTELNKSCWVFQKISPYWDNIMVTLVCLKSIIFPQSVGSVCNK